MIDTLKASQAGFSEKQIEILKDRPGDLVTKSDLLQLELRLEARFNKLDLKQDRIVWLAGTALALFGIALVRYILTGAIKIG